jgi:hypothetical protein
MATIIAGVAAFERELIQDRIRSGNRCGESARQAAWAAAWATPEIRPSRAEGPCPCRQGSQLSSGRARGWSQQEHRRGHRKAEPDCHCASTHKQSDHFVMTTMLGRLLQSVALRSAARKYARRLGPRLRHDYGSGEHYTAAQIRATAARCRLPSQHIAIGLAAFMPKETFEALAIGGDYDLLRNLFRRYVGRTRSHTTFKPAPENSYAGSGGDSSSGHHWGLGLHPLAAPVRLGTGRARSSGWPVPHFARSSHARIAASASGAGLPVTLNSSLNGPRLYA